MSSSLIILTTSGKKELLKGALESLKDETNPILIIDDGSNIDYSDMENNIIIRKMKGMGLTDSWNLGYKYFKDHNYTNCLISNDDVIFPGKVPEDMWNGLLEYKMLGPLSDPIGCGRFAGRIQDVTRYLGGIKDFKDAKFIQERLQLKHPNKRYLELYEDIKGEDLYINGFCFSFNRDIINCEFSKDILFNPLKINTGNEKELQKHRLLDKKAVSIKSYVYHYKGQSLSANKQEIVNK